MKVALLLHSLMRRREIKLADAIRENPSLELKAIIGLRSPAWKVRAACRLARFAGNLGVLEKIPRLGQIFSNTDFNQENPNHLTSDAETYARRHGIFHGFSPSTNSELTAGLLKNAGVDLVVCVCAGIIRKVILDIPGMVFINAHAGRLPKYGGMNVVEWAVYNNDPIYGTLHQIDRGIDTGKILMEWLLEPGTPSTIDELRERCFDLVWEMVPRALTQLAAGKISFRPQPGSQPRIQWFRMHPKPREIVQSKIASGEFYKIQESAAGQVIPVGRQTVPPPFGAGTGKYFPGRGGRKDEQKHR